jgi:hypothetical protein
MFKPYLPGGTRHHLAPPSTQWIRFCVVVSLSAAAIVYLIGHVPQPDGSAQILFAHPAV